MHKKCVTQASWHSSLPPAVPSVSGAQWGAEPPTAPGICEEKRSSKRWESWHYAAHLPSPTHVHRAQQEQSGVIHPFISSFPDGQMVVGPSGKLIFFFTQEAGFAILLKSNMEVQGDAPSSPQRCQGAGGRAESPSHSCARRQRR